MELDTHDWLHFHVVTLFPCNCLHFLTSRYLLKPLQPVFYPQTLAKLSKDHLVATRRVFPPSFSPVLYSICCSLSCSLSRLLPMESLCRAVLFCTAIPPSLLKSTALSPQLQNIQIILPLRFPVLSKWNQLHITNLRIAEAPFLFTSTLSLTGSIPSFTFIFFSASAYLPPGGRSSSPCHRTRNSSMISLSFISR